jgi:hypothetical protein
MTPHTGKVGFEPTHADTKNRSLNRLATSLHEYTLRYSTRNRILAQESPVPISGAYRLFFDVTNGKPWE